MCASATHVSQLERSYSQGMVAGARLGRRHRQRQLRAWTCSLAALVVILAADRLRPH